jgi:tryptophan-rich sensory protein
MLHNDLNVRRNPSRSPRSVSHQLVGLLGWLLLVFVAAAVGAIASVNAQEFYAQLIKPAWAPPAGIFGPVWSVLYSLMGVSAWLVWRSRPSRATYILFFAQLVANALWSWLFFAWHHGAFATAEVLILLVLIAGTIRAFWQSSRVAAGLLLPYVLWVAFASALTWSVWQANPTLL